MKPRFAVAAALAVLAIDTITKVFASKTNWTWHPEPQHSEGWPGYGAVVAVIVGCVLIAVAFQSIGFAVAMAGAVGNIGWAVTTGGTPNTIVDGTLAFNVADIAIQGGGIFGALEVSVVAAGWIVAWQARRAILHVP
jgi:hypothetical protein